MREIATYWIAASYVIGIGLVVDQLRRPLPEWEAAGRSRRFWVALSLILGFHALGQYAAIGYLVGVVPRFRAADRRGPRRTLQRFGAALTAPRRTGRVRRERTGAEDLALVAALMIFAASFIHAALIADHYEEYWLFGVFFAAVTCGQAVLTVLLYDKPRDRRVLRAAVAGNALVVGVWAVSRTWGVPFGPQPWVPEAVGVVDVICALDEMAAIGLLLVALGVHRISGLHLRLASMLAGPLFLFSFVAALGGHGHT